MNLMFPDDLPIGKVDSRKTVESLNTAQLIPQATILGIVENSRTLYWIEGRSILLH